MKAADFECVKEAKRAAKTQLKYFDQMMSTNMNTPEIKIVDRLGTELTIGMRVALAVTVRFGDALRIGIIEEMKIDHVGNTMHKVKVRYTSTDWKKVVRNIAVEVNASNVVAV